MRMKQPLLILAVVALVGCGGSKEAVKKPESPTVEIADPIVEKRIRNKLKKPIGELTKADLRKVKNLNLGLGQLTEVPKGLEKLTQLKQLILSVNQLTEVQGLEKTPQLTELWLNNNKLTDVKGLEKLTNLEILRLNRNQLTDVKGLEKLTRLELLNLHNNPDLTKTQIKELQNALPKCIIYSNPTK